MLRLTKDKKMHIENTERCYFCPSEWLKLQKFVISGAAKHLKNEHSNIL